jgi:hypothetical protein
MGWWLSTQTVKPNVTVNESRLRVCPSDLSREIVEGATASKQQSEIKVRGFTLSIHDLCRTHR